MLGNFVGNAALAAVGTTTPIINTLIGLFLGLSAGIGVVISQFYGAKEEEKVGQAVQTSLLLVLLLCGVFTAVGIAMVPRHAPAHGHAGGCVSPGGPVPPDLLRRGCRGLMLYNLGAGILRAVGDAPAAAVLSPLLGGGEHRAGPAVCGGVPLGIAGRAIATVAAQVLSAGLVLGVLTRSRGMLPHPVAGDADAPGILRNIFVVGVPSALQLAITSFSNVFVQSYVNRFASSCMAGVGGLSEDRRLRHPAHDHAVGDGHHLCGPERGGGELGPGKQGFAVPWPGHGGDGGPFGPADGLCPAPVHPVQPGGRRCWGTGCILSA